ncbi:MAG: hypothetical protein OXC10_21020 [Rhodospirillaceae bacterium]|nr:hypothetical protein [Rhodospirillaceae bacterium]
MGDIPTRDWMERYRDRVNEDPEMAVIGDWFSLDFKLSFEGSAWLLSVREGRIEDIVQRPRFDRPARFTIAAPMRVWTKFIRPDPEPLYHDFFAMLMRVPEFEIDGDSLAAMQNARALHRMMNILKTMEPLDGRS